MEIIKKSEIPEWIRLSRKYKNNTWKKYSKDEVPLFNLENGIQTLEEFSRVLDCIKFWRVYELPPEIWPFLFETKGPVMKKFLLERDDKIAKYLFDFQRKRSTGRYILAMDEGEMECFDYLYRNRDKYELYPTAIHNINKQYANVKVIKYLHEHDLAQTNPDVMRIFQNDYFINFAKLYGGNLESLIYLHENGYEIYPSFMGDVIYRDDVKSFEYLHTVVEMDINDHQLTYAIDLKKMKCVKYLEDNLVIDESTTEQLAKYYKLENLKYAVEKGYPINVQECIAVARAGNKRYLKSLLKRG